MTSEVYSELTWISMSDEIARTSKHFMFSATRTVFYAQELKLGPVLEIGGAPQIQGSVKRRKKPNIM